uniref:Protein kinase domain-containing protein n=1 Tax=Kalanchoe fedtschenkoi TaxID=63787 RepID=A0A7N0RC61_KALFE
MGKSRSVQRVYSANASDYKLLEEIGYGASATVFRAIYLPLNDVVAVKCLDLDRCNSNLDDIRREAQTMSLIDHPNVVSAHCSFVVGRSLWVVMPFMAEGSCLHLMKIAHPDGIDEPAIASILKETLKALVYLHEQGHIHRDVKAGNILLDTNGAVKLADFGVSACLFDSGDRQRSRNTFVGTPCWMAPEVLQPGSGYNSKADIWSFGITALELAHGHAPFSKYPPMKVLLMTIQNAPPGLDYDRDKKFSKSFKEMVAMCLVKDQTKRPTAEKLLKQAFFKNAKPPELTVKKLFADLPPLWNRVKAIQHKDAAQLALKRMPSSEEEALSQSEYQRGVSAWNFDVEDLKIQASLLQDDEDDDVDGNTRNSVDEGLKSFTNNQDPSTSRSTLDADASYGRQINGNHLQKIEEAGYGFYVENNMSDLGNLSKNAQEISESSPDQVPSTLARESIQAKSKSPSAKDRRSQSGPLTPSIVLGHSASERGHTSERTDVETHTITEKPNRRIPSFSGPLMLPNRASANSLSAPIKSSGGYRDSLDEKAKANLVQIKGRFSVTSENVDLVKDIPLCAVPRRSSQGSPLRKSASVADWMINSKQGLIPPQTSKDSSNGHLSVSVITPHLQNLFQQTAIQQDFIMKLMSCLELPETSDVSQNGRLPPLPRSSESNGNAEVATSERERFLLSRISELQFKMLNLTDELNAERSKFLHLQQQLNSMPGGDNGV